MKSLDTTNILKVAVGICEDLRLAFPEYRGVDRDINRLSRLVEHRGLGVFTLDLPQLDTLLLEGLACGRLHRRGPLSQRVSSRCQVPKLFSGLWLRVFDEDSCLLEVPDITAISFLRQIFCLGKRLEVSCTPDRIKDVVKEYYNVETSLRSPTLSWDSDELDPGNSIRTIHFRDGLDADHAPLFAERSRDLPDGEARIKYLVERLQQFCDAAACQFGYFDSYNFSNEINGISGRQTGFRHGPGAVTDAKKGFFKYEFPNWPRKLGFIFPYDSCGTHDLSVDDYPAEHEPPSVLIAVPKTAKGPRLIAKEPIAHQWCQQLIRRFLLDRSRGSFIERFATVDNQEPSKLMAVRASLDGSLATVDLKSASDRLSCWAIERAWRRNPTVLSAFHAVRTRWIRDELLPERNFLKPKKFAAQGSALTFPVQTLFFLCCVMACLPCRDWKDAVSRYEGRVRVFGDDIILPTTGYADLICLLQYLGLAVNKDKSFATGLFRESCGMDAYRGHDVTPVKPKTFRSDTSESRQALLDTANNLFKKGYWRASEALLSTAPAWFYKNLPVTALDSGAVGLASYCGSDTSHLPCRWNDRYQRLEVRAWSLRSHVRRKKANSRQAFLQFVTEGPSQDLEWSSGVDLVGTSSDRLSWETIHSYSDNIDGRLVG